MKQIKRLTIYIFLSIADEKKVYMWGKLNHTLYSCSPKKVYTIQKTYLFTLGKNALSLTLSNTTGFLRELPFPLVVTLDQ